MEYLLAIDLAELLTIKSLIALLTLALLEIVLGIDNVVFLAILSSKLDPSVQKKARRIGLFMAMIMRILLLFAISWVMGLTKPWFAVLGHEISGKDLILFLGGLFLIGKATYEIHERLEEAGHRVTKHAQKAAASFASVIAQVMLLDLVFSLDSVITAVGIAEHVTIMVVAIVLAVIVMMIFAEPVSHFVEKHPTLKILALSFLILIGVMLVAESFHKHVDKGYIYFAMGFSLVVEIINLRMTTKRRSKAEQAVEEIAGA